MMRVICRWLPWLCQDQPEIPDEPPPQGDRAADAMSATNRERAKAQLPALASSGCLANQAQAWAEEMERTARMSHAGFSRRLAACNVGTGSENVAYGYETGEAVVGGWMRSTGHRSNILGNYSHCGIGVSGTYWCQLFGRDL